LQTSGRNSVRKPHWTEEQNSMQKRKQREKGGRQGSPFKLERKDVWHILHFGSSKTERDLELRARKKGGGKRGKEGDSPGVEKTEPLLKQKKKDPWKDHRSSIGKIGGIKTSQSDRGGKGKLGRREKGKKERAKRDKDLTG